MDSVGRKHGAAFADVVCQSLDAQSKHRGIRDKVWEIVANRVPQEDSGPEIGALHGEYDEVDAEEYLRSVGQ